MTDLEYTCQALEFAQKVQDPFPHFFAKNVFHPFVYEKLLEYVDTKNDYKNLTFANRKIADQVNDCEAINFMYDKKFFNRMFRLFEKQVAERFTEKTARVSREIRFIQDSEGYKIGPHTDQSIKVLSLLFYLPRKKNFADCGTVMYAPNDPDFRCEGGPHYPFELFHEIGRAPFLPNTCFGFWKTNNSFHGRPPLQVEIRRDVLLYNIFDLTKESPP